ncbi:MAG: hypothetical protein K2P95_05385 [Hyphomonadaceae bacterium]|nr:hypothetical protein [Hyphomonadaceae bacterium]
MSATVLASSRSSSLSASLGIAAAAKKAAYFSTDAGWRLLGLFERLFERDSQRFAAPFGQAMTTPGVSPGAKAQRARQ